MEAQEIFNRACRYIGQTPEESVDLEDMATAWLDSLVTEAFPYENARRLFEGEDALEVAPVVEDLDTDIPYREDLCRGALVFGLVSYFFMEEEDNYRADDFRGRFIVALRESERVAEEKVQDVYG